MSPLIPKHWPGLGLLALALTTFAFVFATGSAGAADPQQRLAVRGQATAVDGPCSATACPLELARGHFRSSPLGSGAYSGSLTIAVGSAFPNGEGGICAPLSGRIELHRKAGDVGLRVRGDSCQDGSGPLAGAAFTGVARFRITSGTGRYAGASGSGVASFVEDAAKHHQMTLVGRIRSTS
jgi:hypothetical protein